MLKVNEVVVHSFPVWLPQTQTWMHSQVSELQKLGVNAHVVCERTENLDQFYVQNIHCLSGQSRWKRYLDLGLRRIKIRSHLGFLVDVGKATGANIIHSHFGYVGWANIEAARLLGAKHVVTFYGYDVNKLPTQNPKWKRRYKELFSSADLIVCEGTHMADCIIALGCSQNKIRVNHLGIDTEKIQFLKRSWQLGQPLKVLIAASFKQKKGIPFALDALAQLNKTISVELTIIGDGGADEESRVEKSRILKILDDTGLGRQTRLLGYRTYEQMFDEAYKNHIFMHPSVIADNGDTEGGAPVVISEMLATGMPVVTTKHCDIPEVMGGAYRDLLAPEGSVDGLYKCLKKLTSDPANWEGLVIAGRHHMESNYNIRVQGERLSNLYKSLTPSDI